MQHSDKAGSSRTNLVCNPLLNNRELLAFSEKDALWANLVVPLRPCGGKSRRYGHHYGDLFNPILTTEENPPEFMICHDLQGNYRGDRYVEGTIKWDDYRFFYWGCVDHFIYFSHSYITIPPVTWINAAHKNGVKIYGTYIVEHMEGKQRLTEVLQDEDYMIEIVDALVRVAKICKFDGWLLNIEVNVDRNKIPLLLQMTKLLTERVHSAIPGGKVFWYDSVTVDGDLLWQNKLNPNNEAFFEVSDGILTNYGWDRDALLETEESVMTRFPNRRNQVYIGIDSFGRHLKNKGRMHTHELVHDVSQFRFSIQLFAPGWTYEKQMNGEESLQNPVGDPLVISRFLSREHEFWSRIVQHLPVKTHTELPLVTYFNIGSGSSTWLDGDLHDTEPWFNLMKQDIQLSVPSNKLQFYFSDAFNGGSSLCCVPPIGSTRLFTVDYSSKTGYILCLIVKRIKTNFDIEILFKGPATNGGDDLYVKCLPMNLDADDNFFTPLEGDALKRVVTRLRDRGDEIPSMKSTKSNWEIRVFEVKLPDYPDWKVTDIGMNTTLNYGNTEHSPSQQMLLLGGIGIYRGLD